MKKQRFQKQVGQTVLPSADISIKAGSGNVYRNLGYEDSESMLVKAQLAAKIAEIIQRRALTQASAAEILGLSGVVPKIETSGEAVGETFLSRVQLSGDERQSRPWNLRVG